MILKRADKSLSLGLLFTATQLSDLVFAFTGLTGIEKINIVVGTNTATSVEYAFYPYSHSLLATLIWAALIALIFLIVPIKSSLCARAALTRLARVYEVRTSICLNKTVYNCLNTREIEFLENASFSLTNAWRCKSIVV